MNNVSTLMWWLIPLSAVLLGVAITALVTYFRRPPEDHDLGQFASMQEAMKKSHGPHNRRP
jgi:cytochrome c-type biogenesis protein CcmH/NrfF